MPTAAELPINTGANATQMADAIFGNGVTVVNATYTGAATASGIYSNGDTVAPGITPSDTGVILSTGNATDFTNSSGDVNRSDRTTTNHSRPGDSDLTNIAGANTFDAAVLEATFIPQGSVLTMQVTFSSEEYLEYVNTGFNDAVGIFVNGTKAELTIGDGDITINNINNTTNQNLYIDNPDNAEVVNSEMDGLTVTLTLKAPVIPGQENTIKIAIADGGDGAYDSNLLIAGDSVQTALIAQDDDVELSNTAPGTFDILGNDSSMSGGSLTITHINGQPVSAGSVVTLATGEQITVNADGTITIQSNGDEETNTFAYTVTDGSGNTDTAFVNVTTAPCFVAGTLIKTECGHVPVEDLEPGMQVLTCDNGFQPVRWVGTSTFAANGTHAPIRFEAGALGNHEEIELSPNHRVLLRTPIAQMMFGASEVLVKAKDLLNDNTVRRRADGQDVTYVHVLFDTHQIIWGNGLESESYHPGEQTIDAFDEETRDEILSLMPHLDAEQGYGYGPTARTTLRGYEARTLLMAC